MPAGVPAKHRPQPRTRRRFYATWPADTKPSTPRSPNSRETSVVSAPGRTRRCWPPTVWALTQPRCWWSPPATTPGEWPRNGPSRRCAVPALFRHHRDRPGGIVSTGAVTATPTARCGRCATTRMRTDAATKEYVTRRQGEAKNRKEIIRCLKRHIAREIYRLLTNPPPTPNCARLRTQRQQGGITITQAAQALRTHTARISELERGLHHNHQLATRYHNWLRTHQPAPSPI